MNIKKPHNGGGSVKRGCFIAIMIMAFVPVFGQSGTTTVNNTITIHGNVYYFKPSTSLSSALPKVKNDSNWIGDGTWWGEDAAKAWASIVDWVVLHCFAKDPLLFGSNQIFYINRVTAHKYADDRGTITIYYWIVDKGQKMETGYPTSQMWIVAF